MFKVRSPVLRDGVLQAAAEVDRPILLGHAPGMEMLPGFLHRAAMVLDSTKPPLEPDQGLRLRRGRRAPEVVVLVSADRPRKAVFRAEEVERARLAVVAR